MIDDAEQFRVQLAGPLHPHARTPAPGLTRPTSPPPYPPYQALPAAPRASPFSEHLDDLLSVEPAVLDEDVAGRASRGRAAGEKEVWHVGFERLGIQRWRQRVRVALDASPPHQLGVRVISSQEENAFGRNFFARSALSGACGGVVLDDNTRRKDLDDARLEPRGDRPLLDAVLDVGAHPVLDRIAERRMTVHQRHLGAAAEQLERRFSR